MRLALSAFVIVLTSAASVEAAQAQQALIVRHRLPATVAQAGVNAAIAACEAQGHRISAAVVDADGGVQTVTRGDGAGIQTVQSATDKAITSAVFGQDSGYWVDRAARGEPISPLLNQLPHLLLAVGGLVIRVENEVVGGIAVGGAPGGQIDAACAQAGLAAIQSALIAPPRS